jgi:plasmid stabilization system protein ParE
MELALVWTAEALNQFEDAIEYIANQSMVSSENFKIEILKKLNELMIQPERYSIDKFKTNNDGSFRAFEVLRYRISYQYFQTRYASSV